MPNLHLFGMAKSSIDLKGAKGPKLEGDFLRLLLAVTRCRERGEGAMGYLAIPTRECEKRILTWIEKYEAVERWRRCCARSQRSSVATSTMRTATRLDRRRDPPVRGDHAARSRVLVDRLASVPRADRVLAKDRQVGLLGRLGLVRQRTAAIMGRSRPVACPGAVTPRAIRGSGARLI